MLTLTLAVCTGSTPERARLWAEPMTAALKEFEINTRLRQAAFLAQVGWESGNLRYVRELGGAAYLAKYDTGVLAERLGNTPEADGDGQRYRGRGLLQVTGRDNYLAAGRALGVDLLAHPELLEQPLLAARSAGWFWRRERLNALADAQRFREITRRINGGYNGLAGRMRLYRAALSVL